jgi:hypothetical protein
MKSTPTPTASVVSLPGGQAVRLVFTGGSTKLAATEYFVDAGPVAYAFSFLGTAAHLTAGQATFARMMASLRLSS